MVDKKPSSSFLEDAIKLGITGNQSEAGEEINDSANEDETINKPLLHFKDEPLRLPFQPIQSIELQEIGLFPSIET